MLTGSTTPNVPRRGTALRWLAAGGLGLALAIAGHAALWRHAGDGLATGFEAWVAARRLGGWRVEHGAPRRDGWPFAAVLELPRLLLSRGADGDPDSLEWRAETVAIRLAPLWSDRLEVVPAGRQLVRRGGLAVPFAADRLVLAVPLDGGPAPREASLTAERLRLGTPAGAVELRRLSADLTTMRTAVEGEDAIALRLAATEIALPPALGAILGVLGRDIATLTGEVALSGPWPRGGGAAARAEGWRDGGGSLQFRDVVVAWGPVVANADATLALDEALQPMGAATFRVTGGTAAIDAAAAAGLLPAGGVAAARVMLRMLERTPEGDGAPDLVLPATLAARTLTLARIPVARLPAWVWPPGG